MTMVLFLPLATQVDKPDLLFKIIPLLFSLTDLL